MSGAVAAAGDNPVRLWGLTPAERLARIAAAQGMEVRADAPVLANTAHVFDPAWLRRVAQRPDSVVTCDDLPVLAHCTDPAVRETVRAAMEAGEPLGRVPIDVVAWEHSGGLENNELRKKERPFMGALRPETVRKLERQSYFGAYKGVTDLLTKYLWPEAALVLTRIAARLGVTPNQVTTLGAILCVAAAVLFYFGWYWSGLAAGLVFMVLDTVDGKLARCTITSSWWGNVFDHGIDLVHPPFWWWAWGVGLVAYGRPLEPEWFWWTLAVIVGGYVVQRLIEGAFIGLFKIHIHVWRPFDSWFRLITARRNPNMVILAGFLAAGRPDWGLIAVAAWTLASLLVHMVQLVHAMAMRAMGRPVRSWLA